MVQRRRSVLATVIAAVVLSLVGASPATAAPAERSAGVTWERSVATDFTSPAGDLCPFPLESHVQYDLVYVGTFATFPDGSPRVQIYLGPLIVKITNQTSGRSIVRDLSGTAVATYRADGSYDFAIAGPAAVGFRDYRGDSLPTGYYVLNGFHIVRFAADGIRSLVVDQGTEENVCTTLA